MPSCWSPTATRHSALVERPRSSCALIPSYTVLRRRNPSPGIKRKHIGVRQSQFATFIDYGLVKNES
jgi:hypothetical protein